MTKKPLAVGGIIRMPMSLTPRSLDDAVAACIVDGRLVCVLRRIDEQPGARTADIDAEIEKENRHGDSSES